jgi:hypothetical protein
VVGRFGSFARAGVLGAVRRSAGGPGIGISGTAANRAVDGTLAMEYERIVGQ